jgi:hypothetical protein
MLLGTTLGMGIIVVLGYVHPNRPESSATQAAICMTKIHVLVLADTCCIFSLSHVQAHHRSFKSLLTA